MLTRRESRKISWLRRVSAVFLLAGLGLAVAAAWSYWWSIPAPDHLSVQCAETDLGTFPVGPEKIIEVRVNNSGTETAYIHNIGDVLG